MQDNRETLPVESQRLYAYNKRELSKILIAPYSDLGLQLANFIREVIMWTYILTYTALSITVLCAPVVLLCLSATIVLNGCSALMLKVIAVINGILLADIAVIVAVVGSGTVLANAVLGYIVVGILLACAAIVVGTTRCFNFLLSTGIMLRRKWLRQE